MPYDLEMTSCLVRGSLLATMPAGTARLVTTDFLCLVAVEIVNVADALKRLTSSWRSSPCMLASLQVLTTCLPFG